MRVPVVLSGALAALSAVACADETLTQQLPSLVISPYLPAGQEAYDATRTEEVNGTTVQIIDVGRVPFFTSRTATFELASQSTVDVVISDIAFSRQPTGELWLEPRYLRLPDDPSRMIIPPNESRLLEVTYSPEVEGPALAEVQITSNAGNGERRLVRVEATGYFEGGAPDIEVTLNDFDDENAPRGPGPSECDADVGNGTDDNGDSVVDGCRFDGTLDLGNVAIGQMATARLFIANTSSCAPFPGAPSCGTCVLTLDKDPSRQDIGVGFKAGTNDRGLFAFQGSTATPADLPQVDATCNGPSVAPLVLSFTAPLDFGTYEAVIVIESNDPDEPLIEIPVRGQAINAPVAIAGLRAPDPQNPGAPYTDADAIEPQDRVYLDGRARGIDTTTHDPRNPADTSLLTDWRWDFLETPPDTSVADFDVQDDGTGLYSFIVPGAGHYVVRLTVTNTDGVDSLDTPASRVELSAIPAVGLHLQLSWESPTNDQDLHLTAVSEGTDRVCNEPWDCFYDNKRPRWFESHPAGTGPNPTLDRDDTNGLGPENVNIEAPLPGVYRMYVHYYGGYNAFGQSETLATVRVWINSVQVAEYSRSLDRKDAVWAVGDITWFANNTGTVTQYPSDAPNAVGSIDYMASCEPPSGWTFP